MGIEPTCEAWKASVLPLNYARLRAIALWRGKPVHEPATAKSYRPHLPCQPAAQKAKTFPVKNLT